MPAVRNAAAAVALSVSVVACTSTAAVPNDAAVCDAFHSQRSHVEVAADGTVTRLLGVRSGRTSPHEGFLLSLDSGCVLVVRVEANTDFTGTFALRPGEKVAVKGEYEFYPIGGVIHWTHRDPRGRHEGGYIEISGRRYE